MARIGIASLGTLGDVLDPSPRAPGSVVQAALGWTISWSMGHPIHFFGLPIPGPFGALSRAARHDVREIHSYVGWTIVIVALGHALAALYHHYRLHDRVLGRMFPPARESEIGWAANSSARR